MVRDIKSYIFEAGNKIQPTLDWVKEHYVMFNKMYFNSELPEIGDISLEVREFTDDSLGVQGEYKQYYITRDKMKDDKYIMIILMDRAHITYKWVGGKSYAPVLDESNSKEIKSIVELKPFIRINSKYVFTENQLEDTLIHEMVHLYTYKDGLAPRQAHGKEFRAKCKEIRNLAKSKYGKTYDLQTKATAKDEYELTDKQKEKEKYKVNKLARMGNGIIGIYMVLDPNKIKDANYKKFKERFLFTSRNLVMKLINEIKRQERDALTNLYLSEGSYILMCKEYGRFSTQRKYRFWNAEDYSKAKEIMCNGRDVINESISESKEEYESPQMSIIPIPPEIDLSTVNIEDIIDKVSEIEIDDIKGTEENDKKLIK